MNNVFVNTGVDYAITMYLRSKDRPYSTLYNSFLVIVIRMLINIYGELEIVDAYSKNDVNTFKSIVNRYGYDKYELFIDYINKYYDWAKNVKNGGEKKSVEFTLIQQEIIDMMAKKMASTGNSEDTGEFEKLLYTPNNPDPNIVLFNMQVSTEPDSIDYYWKQTLFNAQNDIQIIKKKHNLLNPRYYQTINLTLEEMQKLTEEEIETKNLEIFKKFKVNPSEENFAQKLSKAVDNFFLPDIELTSGSGFADRMVLLSILVTLASIAFIAAIFIFR